MIRHLFLALAAAAVGTDSACAGARCNVLLIVTDDQATDTLGAYGDRAIDTPSLDRLADEGMTFTAARHMGAWSGAVCTPSRRMIMTGRGVWRVPGSPLGDAAAPVDLARRSLPAVFDRAGYATMRTCKSGNSYDAANRLFRVRHDATKRDGSREGGSSWHADRALDFLRSEAAAEPWLVFLGFSHPHDPRRGPPALLKKYGAVSPGPPAGVNPGSPRLPKNYAAEHPFEIGQSRVRDETAVEGVGRRRDEATVRNELAKQAACIESIDTQVGRVLEHLRSAGQLERTYVVFTSDHGIAVGGHGLMGKQNLYEHTWRVPLMIRGPGVEPGARSDALVYLSDLLPTLCALTGVPIPDTAEGSSFAQVVRGERAAHHAAQYGVYAGGSKPGIRAVTDGRWKLIEYDLFEGRVRRTQLFDLQENPHELLERDLSERPEHSDERRRLERLLAEQSRSWGDPFPITPASR